MLSIQHDGIASFFCRAALYLEVSQLFFLSESDFAES